MLSQSIGTAIGFALRNPTYQCPEDSEYFRIFPESIPVFIAVCSAPDDNGVCRLLNMYILLGSWVIPALRKFRIFTLRL